MELLFIRHAESMGNAYGYDAYPNAGLSERGRDQARALAPVLARFDPDFIAVSPLRRAVETACICLQHLRKTAEVWPELAEACWQEGRHVTAGPPRSGPPIVISVQCADWLRLRDEPGADREPPEDENYAEGLQRIKLARRLLLERFGGSEAKVALVGHGHAGGRLLELLMQWPVEGGIGHANCGHSCLVDKEHARFSVRYINRVADAHL